MVGRYFKESNGGRLLVREEMHISALKEAGRPMALGGDGHV